MHMSVKPAVPSPWASLLSYGLIVNRPSGVRQTRRGADFQSARRMPSCPTQQGNCNPFCNTVLAFLLLGTALSAQPNPDRLEPGKAIQHELAGGQSHSYSIRLEAGQFARVVVTQLGVDVLVRLFGPDGQKVAEVDTIAATQGPEPLVWVAQTAGDHRLEV